MSIYSVSTTFSLNYEYGSRVVPIKRHSTNPPASPPASPVSTWRAGFSLTWRAG
ncbi:MAG: hypothetical protein KJ666_11635 [Bacteroidetes bacterium]|nr:hypothetical protein [Bacteroidota bacterium]